MKGGGVQARAQAIAAAHPEIAALHGHNPWTAGIVACLVVLHVVMAITAATLPWWGGVLLGCCVGTLIAHGLLSCMHEAAHQLVFPSPLGNRLTFIAANMPLGVLFAFPMADWHLAHHAHEGEPGRDPYLPVDWEIRAFHERGLAGRIAWHALFPLLEIARVFRPEFGRGRSLLQGWVLADIGAQILFGAIVLPYVPFPMLCYLAVSLVSLLVLHPVNPLFQAEHRDFPGIPWSRLPRLRALAPEWYGPAAQRLAVPGSE
jgi:sphingolipid delta-4 desaturase